MKRKEPTPTLKQDTERMPVFCLRSMLHLLIERAAPRLTHQELQWLSSNAPGVASCLARQLEEVTDGIGFLVSSDEANTGSFQAPYELASLMFFIASQAGLLAGLSEIGETAAGRLATARALQ